MKRSLLATCLVLLSAAVVAPPAEALLPIYGAVKLGNTSLEADLGDPFTKFLDGDDDSWSAALGLRLGKYLAVQAEYHNFGEAPGGGSPCPSGTEACIAVVAPLAADSSALSLSVLPTLPLTKRVSLYGKLGIVSWDSDVDELLDDGSRRFIERFDGEEGLYGFGVRLTLPGPLGAFTEYERIGDQFDSVSIGATVGF